MKRQPSLWRVGKRKFDREALQRNVGRAVRDANSLRATLPSLVPLWYGVVARGMTA